MRALSLIGKSMMKRWGILTESFATHSVLEIPKTEARAE
jgi:hypothetical protein